MRKNCFHLIFTFLSLNFAFTGLTATNSNVEIIERSQNRIVLSLQPFQLKLDQIVFNDQNYTIPNIKNYGRETETGMPILPMTAFLLPLNNTEINSISILESDYELIPEVNVLTNFDLEHVQTFENLNQTEQFWPEKIAKVESYGFKNGQRFARIQINPVKYNSAQKTLKIYNNLKIEINLSSETATQPLQKNKKKISRLHKTASDWYNPSLEYYKLYLSEDGIYSITYDELNSKGALPLNAPSQNIKVINNGEEIPIWIEGDADGFFSENSKLYFYGERNRGETTFYNFYSDTNIYWLTFNGGAGKRYRLQQNSTYSGDPEVHYWETLHLEQENLFHRINSSSAVDPDEGWVWRYMFADEREVINFEVSALSTSTNLCTLKARLHGTTVDPITPDHHIQIFVNNFLVSEQFFDDREEVIFNEIFSTELLTNGQNDIEVHLVPDTGAEINQIFLDWIEIIYPRSFVSDRDRLSFRPPVLSQPVIKFSLFNFDGNDISVFEISNGKLWQPASTKASIYSVSSAGFEDGSLVLFKIDFSPNKFIERGHNLAVINSITGFPDFYNFDTFQSSNASNDMADMINLLTDGTVVLVGISDEGSTSMTEDAYKALESLGSALTRQVSFRDSWAMIGIKNAVKGSVKETLSRHLNGPAVVFDTLKADKAFKYYSSIVDTVFNDNLYFAVTSSGFKQIPMVEKDSNSELINVNQGADYVIITHKKFVNAARELADYREQNNGFRSVVVDVEDIYDEFNFGIQDPHAIKNFLQYIYLNWQAPAPRFLTLFGDASWDPQKHLSESTKINYVPTYGILVSDNWYATFDGEDDVLPEMYIGRIPVETLEQAQIAVTKIIEYEQSEYGNWNKEILFMNGGANEFEQNLFQRQASFLTLDFLKTDPVRAHVTNLNKTTSEPITRLLKKDAQDKIEDGILWINFLGHGASSIWDIDIGHPDEWRNEEIFPFVTGMSCHSGRFANPVLNSLSEEFFLHPRGVAAYWGSSGFGYINQDYFLLQGLLKAVTLDSVRSLGEATTAAKYYLWEQQGDNKRNRYVINQYVLIGDPAMQLRLPTKPELSVKPEDILFDSNLLLISDSTTTIRAKIDNFGLVPTDSILVDFKSQNSSGVLSTIKTIKLAPLANSDTTSVSWVIPNAPGEYSIMVNIDPENKFEEENELNNQASQAVNIFASDLLPIKPTKYGVIKINNPKLIVSNSKSNTRHLDYIFELDTDESFSSANYSSSGQKEEQNLITSWNAILSNSGTYFWRVRTYNGESFGPWSNSSFLYFAGSESDWHQSGSQYSENNFEKITIDSDGIRLKQNHLTFRVESAGFFQGIYGLIYVNEQALGPSLRGHNIVILSLPDGNFIDYHNVDTFSDANASDSLATIINRVGNNTFVLVAISDEGSTQLTEIGYQALESIGSQYTRQVGFRDSWAIIGRKGAPIGSVPEIWKLSGEGPAVLRDTLNLFASAGTITSTDIGPALSWQTANFDFTSDNITESIAFNIIARNSSSGKVDTLIRDFRETDVNLTGIDAKLYPKIQLQATLQSQDGLSTPQLKSWSVDYAPPPDLVVGNKSIVLSKDTVQTAEQLSLTIDSGNFGLSASDSFTIRISLTERGQAAQQAELLRVPGISIDEYALYNTILNTDNLRGRVVLNVEMDALNEIPEINESNNLTSTEFWVVDDTLSPDIRLTFDGREITQDEFVALSPRIMIEINDSGAVLFTDTAQVTVFLDSKKIPFGVAPGQAEFLPSSNLGDSELKATVLFTPTLTDGDHVLEIIAKDVSDNSKYMSADFIVSEDFTLTHVMNYPNPFSSTTEFTYIITQPADAVKIKIFTVAGRLIMILDNLPAQVGFNQFLWDGRDRDGDRIANGVYLYKVIAQQSSRQAEVIEKLVIMR